MTFTSRGPRLMRPGLTDRRAVGRSPIDRDAQQARGRHAGPVPAARLRRPRGTST